MLFSSLLTSLDGQHLEPQALDADKFREFEARREDIARKDIESRDLGAEARFHFGERSEEERAQERLRSIRKNRDERSAADRLAEESQAFT